MAKTIDLHAREELVGAISERYRACGRVEKRQILNEFVAVTGFHRKHAIRVLRASTRKPAPTRRARLRLYDAAVRDALIVLWEASDRVCGKRLKPLLPLLVAALERHGHLQLDDGVRVKVMAASASTIDRLLSEPRAATEGRTRKKPTGRPALRRSVPVRTFDDWKAPPPGFMEADLVAHCGGDVSGHFVHSFTLTDIATGWTECVALAAREGSLIVEALTRLRTTLPFPLLGFDTDNGSEFVNETVLAYCNETGVEFTRSRPYRKNDQAWVEQKNGSVVRRLVGYRRLQGLTAAEALSRLYAASRLFVNFYQPSFKLAEKKRVGARVTKRYHAPETPCARLLQSDLVPEAVKERLRAVAITLDPLRLLDEIRGAQHQLARIAAGEKLHLPARSGADLDQFLKTLATAWHVGEVRPTHAKLPKPVRHWRTRTDAFAEAWPRILLWLDADPDTASSEVLDRLQAEHPGQYPDDLLRTLQRRLKAWRQASARRLVFPPELELGHARGQSERPSLRSTARMTTRGTRSG